ncbi:molybdopterin adenylyltransferase [Helicovermis profundi]|uniref:MogA/MoaB family molybdenum cofactor biosynthesis protein n=1 Tax=Helicovermis profundi TaxID=3065157 RepID=A0AAU9ED26_9FIRM|nr:MogA/MoaB family molybdenum cofactor biosynthesis protein [Clostridia bacterium S502]
MITVGIITASDKGYAGKRIDKSGELIKDIMVKNKYKVVKKIILPDERELISKELINMVDSENINLILTTGGTGFSMRDITPEATKDVIDREVPGIPEAMRAYSMKITPKAMLSRSVAGIRKQSLIINLPGSPKAVKENLEFILPALKHGLEILLGLDSECALPIKK